jgi:large subunit ribosomal protein L6
MTTITTSRIGRKPVVIPSGVDVKIQGDQMMVKGPKGHLTLSLHPFVKVTMADGHVSVEPDKEKRKNITGINIKLYRSIAGTVRANIHNSIEGVHKGFERKLTLIGVGYRAQAKGKVVSLSLGYSHPTNYSVPEGIVVETPTQTEIIVKGASKELVGQVAAQIRAMRGPEPYKGKGVRYANETVEIKETKKK